MTGFKNTEMIPGTVPRIMPISKLEAFKSFNFSGMMLGVTVSMKVKQKSPHRIQQNNRARVDFV